MKKTFLLAAMFTVSSLGVYAFDIPAHLRTQTELQQRQGQGQGSGQGQRQMKRGGPQDGSGPIHNPGTGGGTGQGQGQRRGGGRR